MIPFVFLLSLAVPALHFDISDARGKKPAGVSVEAGSPDHDGWVPLSLSVKVKGKSNPGYVLIWPLEGLAKVADGPGDTPVMVIQSGDSGVLASPRAVTALAVAKLLGHPVETGIDAVAFDKAVAALTASEDPFAKGVALLSAGKAVEAAEPLARALRERERQLTRVPSEIYPSAVLSGKALLAAGKFDPAAVAFLKALQLRPTDEVAGLRREALAKAGKELAR